MNFFIYYLFRYLQNKKLFLVVRVLNVDELLEGKIGIERTFDQKVFANEFVRVPQTLCKKI